MDRIVARIDALPEHSGRTLVAIAGAPGSGKSTVAEAVVAALVARGEQAVLMPMDGFHLDNRLLDPRGLLARKGAPETFDFGGFLSTIRRVRGEASVVIPVFDRSREIAIAGAAEIGPETAIVIVEGNYLCLDEEPWRALAPLWDLSVFLDVPVATLEQRLVERWLSHGFDRAAAEAKARGNDLRNAERVQGATLPTDLTLKN
ncbi:nucleoside triphosphate hydrolase [Sinisalibacter lacisalsi]|uniref:Nucleoside triphosphate hydrolase n=1 Tax=Sinisalibacter lacisalsi TaxID=1526570 RepID=A0ABQ1QM22_9RHOB|nr:nucleoside triphosphate hydrolase [Sinisalibacter lacisalsi]